jgi:hypothetical protein
MTGSQNSKASTIVKSFDPATTASYNRECFLVHLFDRVPVVQ